MSNLAAIYQASSPFVPIIPQQALAPIATVTLSLAFVGSFYFTTIKNKPSQQLATAALVSGLTGLGVVGLFCAVGVNV